MRFRFILFLLVICSMIFSCGRFSSSEESENRDSTKVYLKENLWNIPLTENWKDQEHFVLALPDDYGIDLMTSSTPHKTDDLLTDTLQGKILKRLEEPLLNNGCRTLQSLQVELGNEPRKGWVKAEDVFTIALLDIATFSNGDATFKVGLMEPWSKQDEDGTCYFIHTIFLYDDNYLYLIDAEGTDFDLHWENARHLSVVNSISNIGLTGVQEESTWLLTWGEPNVTKELRLIWAGDHVKFHSINTIDVDDINPDGDVEVETEGEIITTICKLQYVGLGDCFHREFDCGDFGSARTELSEEDAKLWQDLSIEDNGEEVVNPKYAGKEFEITYQVIIGEGCGDPSEDHSRDKIQYVTRFKLKK